MLKDMLAKLTGHSDSESAEESQEKPQQSQQPTLSTDKIKAVIAELNNADPVFSEAGFMMEQLDVEIGASSKLTPHFRQIEEISSEEEQQILDQIDPKSIIKFVVLSLFKASKIKALMEHTDMFFHEVEIEIATSPIVKTTFKREHSVASSLEITKH